LLFCHHGMSFRSGRDASVRRLLPLLLLLVQAWTAGGQDSPAADSVPTDSVPKLPFKETEFDTTKAGHVALEWKDVEEAVEYVVVDNHGDEVYRGPLPRAFVSGLSDGHYSYQVTAYDEYGEVLAKSDVAAEITVEHWPLQYALGLFAVGLDSEKH